MHCFRCQNLRENLTFDMLTASRRWIFLNVMRWAPNHNCVIVQSESRYYTCVAAERQSLEQSLAARSQTRRSNIPSSHRTTTTSAAEHLMSDFEDHNPFQVDNDDVHSEPESSSNVDLSSEPDTPPAHPSRILASPPASPGVNRSFTTAQVLKPAPLRPPPQVYKSDFCCARDRWLHSGEDVEIQVCRLSLVSRLVDVLTLQLY